MHATCMLHDMRITCVQPFRIKNCFRKCSVVIDVHTCTRMHRWSGVSIRSDAEIQNEYLHDILGIYTFFLNASNMTCQLHETCMSPACSVLALVTMKKSCAVHSLTCIQHAFCPYCNMHVVLTCTTHDYNIYVTGMFGSTCMQVLVICMLHA